MKTFVPESRPLGMASGEHPLTSGQALSLAMDHFRAGRLSQAEALLQQVLATAPGTVAALDLMGCIAQQTGRDVLALALFRRALGIAPDDPFLHFNLGVALEARGDGEAALASFQKVTALRPDHVRAQDKCGDLQYRLGRYREAAGRYRRALALTGDDAALYNKLGNALQQLHNWTEAEEAYRRALRLRPGFAAPHNNLGAVLQRCDKHEEAQVCYHQALALDPHYADAHSNLGNLLQESGQPDEAVKHYREALGLDPGNDRIQWNLATALLLCGDYEEGFRHYERRFMGADNNALARRTLARLAAVSRWQGENLRGKTLLVWTEQGLGDNLMMLRYLPLLRRRGAARIVVACLPPLTRLVTALPAVDAVIGMEDPVPGVDLHCPIMSLPHLFGTLAETVPAAVPYLTVAPALSAPWQRRLEAYVGKKVGLVWAGSRTQETDARRSLPFVLLAPLLAVPGIQFVSLQKKKEAPAGDDRLLDWMAACGDLLDTAALISGLDLIISVDTAVAHLAGALAKPVWLLNRYESEWRWGLAREDSPWYPTLRLFRQANPGDWDSVITGIAAALHQWARLEDIPPAARL